MKLEIEMKKEKQIDLVEEAMKNAYSGEVEIPEISSTWQSEIMNLITSECTPEDAEAETVEKEFLYFSGIAAGIAAALIIVSSIITYSTQSDTFENDINNLYSDNTLNNMTTEMVIK